MRSEVKDTSVPLPSYPVHGVVPFDIDLSLTNKEDLQKEFDRLAFIVGLSMMYAKCKREGNIIKTNYMVIMKPEGASISDPSICYFTHNTIGRLTSIFSGPSALPYNSYYFSQIIGSLSTTGSFGFEHERDREWLDNDFFFPISLSEFRERFGHEDDVWY